MKARVRDRAIAAPAGIALATFAAFLPALSNGFVDWDDNLNFLSNPHYRGLGWDHVRWMLTSTLLGHWMPVTWFTLALDYLVWGMRPFGYHLTSLLFHAANAALFYELARRLLARASPDTGGPAHRLAAAIAALFFALHPLRAESVAWVTERRDVVSGFFGLLTVLAYLRMVEAPAARRRGWLAASLVCFALGLAAKASVMTLPLVLLLLDVYPLGRLGAALRRFTARATRQVWLEKTPYVLLGIASGATAFWAQRRTGLLTSLQLHPPFARLAMGAYSLIFYLWKTLVPVDLMPEYELPPAVRLADPSFLACAVIAIGITVALAFLYRRWPTGLVVWLAYGVLLAPVSGIVHTGHHLVADRYSYVASAPLAMLGGALVLGAIHAIRAGVLAPRLARVVSITGFVWLLGLAAISWNQAQIWKDTETLWRYAVDVDPDCALCHSQLGAELGNRGLAAPALEEFSRSVALRPDDPGLRGNLGLALLRMNRTDEALAQFRTALARRPHDAGLRNRLGAALLKQGTFAEASAELHEAVRLDPDHAEAWANLALATHALGRPDEASRYLRRALALKPDVASRFDPRLVAALLAPASGSAAPAPVSGPAAR